MSELRDQTRDPAPAPAGQVWAGPLPPAIALPGGMLASLILGVIYGLCSVSAPTARPAAPAGGAVMAAMTPRATNGATGGAIVALLPDPGATDHAPPALVEISLTAPVPARIAPVPSRSAPVPARNSPVPAAAGRPPAEVRMSVALSQGDAFSAVCSPGR